MASVRPFQALRFDPAAAGPLETLVAPPYDVISSAQRDELQASSPHNITHLTLPDSADGAARTLADWRQRGVLVRDERPAAYVIEQDFVGPDGIARTRTGLAASLEVEPYEAGTILPHERTHRGPKEDRLRLLREVHTQLEPIFCLYHGPPPLDRPDRPPDLEIEGTRVWRVEDDGAVSDGFADRELLIADGHHRYETALAFHEEMGTPESGRTLAVLVSSRDDGLAIFPTHRVFERAPEAAGSLPVDVVSSHDDAHEALASLADLDYERPAAIRYAADKAELLVGPPGELDVQLVDRLGHDGISYTPRAEEATASVDRGEADVAFLIRALRIEDVFAVARRGEVMPQKSTYFYPKLTSGLLLHPV
ncbi:DUF1015 domain-containing protein [Egibacter rhizosphaerae]|uniref:DUF1015 domain-containing protein n=1 Tax=Egibacter rhizosphaerae TaxID=1670831 RepID=A0A411YHK5_9ACTN|nr:DUF1015 domain-containing protein [Egibacter rhizosphaerae]QBI20562.1 DUF1015 domain-containing protein [Egibacter rhizosphaerae]